MRLEDVTLGMAVCVNRPDPDYGLACVVGGLRGEVCAINQARPDALTIDYTSLNLLSVTKVGFIEPECCDPWVGP